MLTNKKTISKLKRCLNIYKSEIFIYWGNLELKGLETFEHFRTCPDDDISWNTVQRGDIWGEPWKNLWLKGQFSVPDDFQGEKLYLQADTGAVEVLLITDGQYKGLFNIETEEGVRGHHHTRLIITNPVPGSEHSIALECYAGHPCVGTHPFDAREVGFNKPATYRRTFNFVRLCEKRQNVSDFVTELNILLQIAEMTGSDSFRGAGIYRTLQYVFKIIPQQPSDYSVAEVDDFISKAREIMKPLLQMRNGGSAPKVGIIGHSHLDTAWLWTMKETVRKVARTFSNTLNLMDEYPEYMFFQSAPYHMELIKNEYPSVFQAVKEKIQEGRWEPNGGSWIEPDCNIPSGESLTRHFLYGQKFLMENFNYRADSFWQPDVFSYSASIPQILKQCGIENFLTTKIGWNEDTRFPYDTFHWHGIDGSSVLTHFNTTEKWIDPQALVKQTDIIQHKDYQTSRLCSFGYGDGGGGPLWEMLEIAPYIKDLDGVPKTEYTTVRDFMNDMGSDDALPLWKGELYLELHRGALTSLHNIKRLNRAVENLLREGEFLSSCLTRGDNYPEKEWETLWKVLLRNQFHDILPGTSINEVNEKAISELSRCHDDILELIHKLTGDKSESNKASGTFQLWNSRGWNRTGYVIIDAIKDSIVSEENLMWQRFKTVNGESKLLIEGLSIPEFGSRRLSFSRVIRLPFNINLFMFLNQINWKHSFIPLFSVRKEKLYLFGIKQLKGN